MTPHDPETDCTTFLGRPASLARLFSLEDQDDALWSPEDTKAMWNHQLSAHLDGEPKSAGSRPQGQSSTFAALFSDPSPSLDLLQQSKDLAKRMIKDAADKQLKDIAGALYYSAYAAALVRLQKRLGGLGDSELKRGFTWLLKQTWLDDTTRRLLTQADALLPRAES